MEILPYIFLASLATILTRFLPLFLFKKKTASPNLAYLQKNSGLLIMVVLTIYALKTMLPSFSGGRAFSADVLQTAMLLFCLIMAFVVHAKFRNSLVTIALPTLIYMAALHFLLNY